WSESSVRGCKRFLDRVAGLTDIVKGEGASSLDSSFHKTIKKVSSDIEEMKFNTAIAAMMSLLNEIYDSGSLTKDELMTFITLLCPFAPHLCEEMNEFMGGKELLSRAPWPVYDEAKTVDDTIEIAVQVLGKVRTVIEVSSTASKDEIISKAKEDPKIASLTEGKSIVKEIYVPGKLVNFVIK
ncbi:MAG: class I tRNA ligase family protein, partial [Firmicutes bacterium]|nr:class I tRNA ligase family protein [Bacillota bacterium]